MSCLIRLDVRISNLFPANFPEPLTHGTVKLSSSCGTRTSFGFILVKKKHRMRRSPVNPQRLLRVGFLFQLPKAEVAQGSGSRPDQAKWVHFSATKTVRDWIESSNSERCWRQVDPSRANCWRTHRSQADQRGHSTHFVGGHSRVDRLTSFDESVLQSIAGLITRVSSTRVVTAEDFSLRTSIQNPLSELESVKTNSRTEHPRIEAQRSQSSQHLYHDSSTISNKYLIMWVKVQASHGSE